MATSKSPFSLAVLPDGRQILTDRVTGIATIHPPGTHPTDPASTNIVVTELREPAKDTVIRARVPAELATRLHAAGAVNGGASAVLRSLLEQGLSEIEAAAGAKISDPAHRERFVATRKMRAAERASQARKPAK
jgi:hypothetical protein